ncbi:unnamed protein product [Urochloa decumbens]|uniref:AAA+ ATPase domain-containing protein n=1 Tax=Urochloa decumbens TaxID=240449 RepID=A0ABC9G4Y1_9POAL
MMDLSTVLASPSYAKAADAYKKAVATVTAYTVLARGIARELVPYELRAAARWAVSTVRDRLAPPAKPRRIKTIYIFPYGRSEGVRDAENSIFWDARAYLATRIDPSAMRRLCSPTPPAAGRCSPFLKRREYYRRIGKAWKRGYLLYGLPGTGKSSLVAAMANYLRFDLYDLDLSRVSGNRSLQKLLTAMPNKSILVIEDIDCCFSAKSRDGTKLRTKNGDDESEDFSDVSLPPPRKSFTNEREHISLSGLLNFVDGLWSTSAKSREGTKQRTKNSGDESEDCSDEPLPPPPPRTSFNFNNERTRISLSGLLNFVDGLWSTSGEERIIVFTTNYKERLDPALLRPGRMDMHIYMGHCCWEAFKTLAKNYFLVDDHELFPEIQELLSAVDVTPAEASEMLLRSEDADIALRGLVEFLQDKKKQGKRRSKM